MKFSELGDAVADELDNLLKELNIEYAAKRNGEKLQKLEVTQVAQGTFFAYKRHKALSGQREGQFKIVGVQYKQDVTFDFESAKTSSPHRHPAKEFPLQPWVQVSALASAV